MQYYIDQDILSCCSTLVMRGTDVLDYQTFGFMDKETKQPLRDDAIYRMYSNTKIVTSVGLMMLYEEGAFDLDDPLAKFLPEFSDLAVLKADAASVADVEPANDLVRIRQVLSHSAGFSYGFIEPESVIDSAYSQAGLGIGGADYDLEELCARLAKQPLAYQPGTSWRYSFATDVCARLIEVLSGERFDQYLKERIFSRLKMHDTDFWVPPDKTERFTTMYAPDDLFDPMQPGMQKADDPAAGQYSSEKKFLSGGGGLVSTVSDYLSFLKVIVNDGDYNGVRLLKADTLKTMRSNQLAPEVEVAFPMWAMPGTVFGLGFALRQTLADDDPRGSQDEYHWGGMAGTHSWMAPQAGITGFCLTQRMPGFWHPFSHEFRALSYEIAGATAQ
jgi:CubicO group peptidase (beta-lactamase class C family)